MTLLDVAVISFDPRYLAASVGVLASISLRMVLAPIIIRPGPPTPPAVLFALNATSAGAYRVPTIALFFGHPSVQRKSA